MTDLTLTASRMLRVSGNELRQARQARIPRTLCHARNCTLYRILAGNYQSRRDRLEGILMTIMLSGVLKDIGLSFASCERCGRQKEGHRGPYCFNCECHLAELSEAAHAWEDENEHFPER